MSNRHSIPAFPLLKVFFTPSPPLPTMVLCSEIAQFAGTINAVFFVRSAKSQSFAAHAKGKTIICRYLAVSPFFQSKR